MIDHTGLVLLLFVGSWLLLLFVSCFQTGKVKKLTKQTKEYEQYINDLTDFR